jgi:hypothetical protein
MHAVIRKRDLHLTIACSIISSLAGCGTLQVTFSQTHAAPHPLVARPVAEVEVLTSAPTRGYVEIGMVKSREQRGFVNKSDSEIVAAMREEAAIQGCDGLVVNQVQMHYQDNAICIVYTGP